ncbi:MAG: aminotransferase class I/II-fold pyridoxal phosphate-dependent enzyme [Candidatus Eisenbacteria bacterium]
MSEKQPAIETRLIHGPHHAQRGPVSTPVVRSATFTFDSLEAMAEQQRLGAAGSFYQRNGHPTTRAVEERLAALEGSEGALLFPSGMAAISAVFLSIMRTGDHAVCVDPCYGGTQAFLEWARHHMGWDHTLVDARRPDTWEAAFRPNTRLLHLETPINPTLVVFDIAQAAALGRAKGVKVTIDNTIASPLGQQPLSLGCHLAMYSATKSLSGHSDILAGAVMGAWDDLQPAYEVRKVFGPTPDPDMAFLLERSLKTMAMRVATGNANALALAERLQQHARVVQVLYPGLASHPGHAIATRQMSLGFGPLLGFEVVGGAQGALCVVEALRLVRHGASLGGVETLCSLAAHTSHIMLGREGRERAGIPEGLIRVSAGCEAAVDLWADLEQALARLPDHLEHVLDSPPLSAPHDPDRR